MTHKRHNRRWHPQHTSITMTKISCNALRPLLIFISITQIITTLLPVAQAFVTTPHSTSIFLDNHSKSTARRHKARRTNACDTKIIGVLSSRTHKYYSTLQDTNEDVVLYSDTDYDDDDDADDNGGGSPWEQNPRWHNLSPSLKKRIAEEAQQKAVRNKKKREPSSEKKRRE